VLQQSRLRKTSGGDQDQLRDPLRKPLGQRQGHQGAEAVADDHRRPDRESFEAVGDLAGLIAGRADEARTAAEAVPRAVDGRDPAATGERSGGARQPVLVSRHCAVKQEYVLAGPLPDGVKAPAGAEFDGRCLPTWPLNPRDGMAPLNSSIDRTPRLEVEGIAVGKDVDPNVVHGEGAFGASLRDVAIADVGAIDDIDGAASDHLEGVALDNRRRILVDAEAQNPGIVGDGADQAAEAAALGEMLVDDDVADEAPFRATCGGPRSGGSPCLSL
jgi:hypothetical protein